MRVSRLTEGALGALFFQDRKLLIALLCGDLALRPLQLDRGESAGERGVVCGDDGDIGQ